MKGTQSIVFLPTITLRSGSLWYPQLLRLWHVPKEKCMICKCERKCCVLQMTYEGPTPPGHSTFELRTFQLSSPLFFLGVTFSLNKLSLFLSLYVTAAFLCSGKQEARSTSMCSLIHAGNNWWSSSQKVQLVYVYNPWTLTQWKIKCFQTSPFPLPQRSKRPTAQHSCFLSLSLSQSTAHLEMVGKLLWDA